jgi:Putative rhamnosyl transferase
MDFSLVILIGRRLPARFKAQLVEVTGPHPQFVLHEEDEGQPHMDLCKAVLLKHRDPAARVAGEFRMDDDDAVAVDFIEKSRAYAAAIDPLIASGRPVELDFCHGLALEFDGPKARAKEIIAAHWGCAQVFFNLAKTRRTAFHHHHYRSWHHDFCLSAPDPLMFVRSFHDHNDSGRSWDKLQGNDRNRAKWPRRFGFDMGHLLA